MHGTDDLIEKAREIIPVADAENIEIAYAGLIGDDEDALIWFVSGNEYQAHNYLPMECKIVGKDTFPGIIIVSVSVSINSPVSP